MTEICGHRSEMRTTIGCLQCTVEKFTTDKAPKPDSYTSNVSHDANLKIEISNVDYATNLKTALSDPKYASLRRILNIALVQAARGKGNERHADGEPFQTQRIVSFGKTLGSIVFNVGQVAKKSFEAVNLKPAAAIRELLGAINYLAGAIIIIEELWGDQLTDNEHYTRSE